jgi:transcriptional antiterminator RfaH
MQASLVISHEPYSTATPPSGGQVRSGTGAGTMSMDYSPHVSPGAAGGVSAVVVPFDRPAWYAVQVKRCSEGRTAQLLKTRSISAFLPLIETIRRRGRTGMLARLEPLFPGYLFVQMAPVAVHPEAWHAVRWAPGVRRILGADGDPIAVPDGVVEAIQAKMRDLGFVRPGARFAAGDRVTMRHGPFAGLEAVFERPMSRRGRVLVLLELLGEARHVEIDEVDLEST